MWTRSSPEAHCSQKFSLQERQAQFKGEVRDPVAPEGVERPGSISVTVRSALRLVGERESEGEVRGGHGDAVRGRASLTDVVYVREARL